MLLLTTLALLTQAPTHQPINLAEARAAFQLAQKLWDADQGKLWGTSLRGPLIFVEPRSRRAVANVAYAEGLLKADGELFTGTLPSQIPVANFSVKWAGVTWIMVMWPLPRDAAQGPGGAPQGDVSSAASSAPSTVRSAIMRRPPWAGARPCGRCGSGRTARRRASR